MPARANGLRGKECMKMQPQDLCSISNVHAEQLLVIGNGYWNVECPIYRHFIRYSNGNWWTRLCAHSPSEFTSIQCVQLRLKNIGHRLHIFVHKMSKMSNCDRAADHTEAEEIAVTITIMIIASLFLTNKWKTYSHWLLRVHTYNFQRGPGLIFRHRSYSVNSFGKNWKRLFSTWCAPSFAACDYSFVLSRANRAEQRHLNEYRMQSRVSLEFKTDE